MYGRAVIVALAATVFNNDAVTSPSRGTGSAPELLATKLSTSISAVGAVGAVEAVGAVGAVGAAAAAVVFVVVGIVRDTTAS